MIDAIQVKIMMIKDGRGGTIAEHELKRLEEEYRLERRGCVSEIKNLERRNIAGEDIAEELQKVTERLRSIELELRDVDDFRIIYKDKIS